MSGTRAGGYLPSWLLLLPLLALCVGHVSGRAQELPQRQGEGDNEPFGNAGLLVRTLPELLFEPSLESAASPHLIYRTISPPSHPPNPPPASGPDLSGDLEREEEEWEEDPDVMDSDSPPPPPPPNHRVSQGSVKIPDTVQDDVDVDRLQGHVLGFHDDQEGDLALPELWQTRNAPGSIPPPPPPPPRAPPSPARPLLFRPQPTEKDLDVDRLLDSVMPAKASSTQPASGSPEALHTTSYDTHVASPLLSGIDKAVYEDRAVPLLLHTTSSKSGLNQDGTPSEAAPRDVTSTDLNADKNESRLDTDDDADNEVPEELARRVVQALTAVPAWRLSDNAGTSADMSGANGRSRPELATEDSEEREGSGLTSRERVSLDNGRLIALIYEAVYEPEDLPEGWETDHESLQGDMNLWSILHNFPFQFLFGSEEFGDDYDDDYDEYDDEDYDSDEYSDEYEDDENYDDEEDEDDEDYSDEEDEDDEDYSDEEDEDDEDYSDEEDEDDEDYEEEDDDDEYDDSVDDDESLVKESGDNDSDEDDSDDLYDDCNDCDDDDDVAKDTDFTVLSLASFFTK